LAEVTEFAITTNTALLTSNMCNNSPEQFILAADEAKSLTPQRNRNIEFFE
jgi:hypothetical protein